MSMSDGTISVTYAGLEAASADIAGSARHLESQLADIRRKADSASQYWSGSAQEAYHRTQTAWNQHAESLGRTLDAISKAVTQAAEHYQATDKKAASRWQH